MTVLEIQKRLAALGYNPGDLDGIPGPMTRAAVKQFQRARNLEADGIVGPITFKALFPDSDKPPSLPWVSEAMRYFGLDEIKNAKVLDKALNLDASAIPWCGAFVSLCISSTLPDEKIPANPLWAQNWIKFGRDPGAAYFGAVAVFKRNGGGHVAFTVGHDKTYVHVLGGNQSNRVSVVKIAKSRLLGYRWPSTFSLVGKPLEYSTFTGKISTNEA